MDNLASPPGEFGMSKAKWIKAFKDKFCLKVSQDQGMVHILAFGIRL